MTQDTIISLVVGGVIGFLFSFLTNLINFRFQLHRDREAKKWEQEKKQQEEGEKIINARLAILETEVLEVMENIMLAGNTFSGFFKGTSDIEELISFRKKYLLPSANKVTKILTRAFYFKDDNLHSTVIDIYESAYEYSRLYHELIKYAKANDKESIDKVAKDIDELQVEFTNISGDFLTSIDMISMNAQEQFKKIKKSHEVMSDLRKMHEKTRRDKESNKQS
jgi:hypothetical protein